MSFFSRLTAAAVSSVSAVASAGINALEAVSNEIASLDALQDSHGDPSGKKALYKGLDFTYLTPRFIAMGFPTSPDTKIRSRNDAASVAALLKERHDGYFMIWNLSEESYDPTVFDNQVQEVHFPGFPAPPLGLLFKICTSIENWLNADPHNVAVVHCMTGKGRTACVSACALAWLGEMDSPTAALDYVCERRGSSVDAMCVPSQARYTRYFEHVLHGVKPRPGPSILRRVIINGIPDFSKPLLAQDGEEEEEEEEGGAEGAEGAAAGDGGAGQGGGGAEEDPLRLGAVGRIADAVFDAAESAENALVDGSIRFAQRALAAAQTAKAALRGDMIGQGIDAATDVAGSPGAGASEASAEDWQLVGGAGDGEGASTVGPAAAAAPAAPATAEAAVQPAPAEPAASAAAAAQAAKPARRRRIHGCRPYLQLFRSGRLIFCSTWTRGPAAAPPPAGDAPADGSAAAAVAEFPPLPQRIRGGSLDGTDPELLRWHEQAEGSIRFAVDLPVAGDVLIRVRHYEESDGSRDTVWRAGFHTGYVTGHVLRLSRRQLDIASADARFDDECFAELIFAPVALAEGHAEAGGAASAEAAEDGAPVAPLEDPITFWRPEGSLVVSARDRADYDATLDAESDFWAELDERRRTRGERSAAAIAAGAADASAAAAGSSGGTGEPRSGCGPTLDDVIYGDGPRPPATRRAAALLAASRAAAPDAPAAAVPAAPAPADGSAAPPAGGFGFFSMLDTLAAALSDQPEGGEEEGAQDAEAVGAAATTPGGRPATVAMVDAPQPTATAARGARADARAAAAISRDIAELEALEMELGIGSLTSQKPAAAPAPSLAPAPAVPAPAKAAAKALAPAPAPAAPSAAAPAPAAPRAAGAGGGDEIDELEKYLSTLG